MSRHMKNSPLLIPAYVPRIPGQPRRQLPRAVKSIQLTYGRHSAQRVREVPITYVPRHAAAPKHRAN